MKCEDSRKLFSRQMKIRGFLLYMDKMAIMTVDDFGKSQKWKKQEQGWKV